MKKTRMEKGITLIALIITIVVLLILAAVAISSITNDGILSYAQNAAKDYNKAVLNEKYYLTELEEFLTENQTGIKVEKVTDVNPSVLEGSGTQADPYVINSIEDLVFFSYDVREGNNYASKYVELGLSLDFNSTKSYVDAYRTDYEEYGYNGELKTLLTSGAGFIPIGTFINDNARCFGGTFDAKGNSIYNLYMNIVSDDGGQIGFFTYSRGSILNLNLLNVDITTESETGGITGAINGQLSSAGSIKNCVVSGKITGKTYNGDTGGIAGYMGGSIEKCKNLCNIYSNGRTAGGITGATNGKRNY